MNIIEVANHALVDRFILKQSDNIPDGAIIMVTGGKELSLLKEPTTADDLFNFENTSAMIAQAGSGVDHTEYKVLFVTVGE